MNVKQPKPFPADKQPIELQIKRDQSFKERYLRNQLKMQEILNENNAEVIEQIKKQLADLNLN